MIKPVFSTISVKPRRSQPNGLGKALFMEALSFSMALFFTAFSCLPCSADMDEAGSLGEEQMKEKEELRQMKNELGDVKLEIDSAMSEMQDLNKRLAQPQEANREFHLFARETDWETYRGVRIHCLTYNGKIPGPVIQVTEGDLVKIVLHNQMKIATSLCFHGLIAPHSVGGIPRVGAGLVEAGQTYAYVFQAKQPGTFWYHPQLVHPTQRQLGLYGAIVVEPRLKSRPYDKDLTLIFSELRHGSSEKESVQPAFASTEGTNPDFLSPGAHSQSSHVETDYLINGKPAPFIPAIELRKGERVRLRLINAGQESVPLSLTGHKMEIVSINGGDRLEPHVFRDTFMLNPSDRLDVDITADNPGVWSLASELARQSTFKGKFPGGMAFVVRYSELKVRSTAVPQREPLE